MSDDPADDDRSDDASPEEPRDSPPPRRRGRALAIRAAWIALGLAAIATPPVLRVAWEGDAELEMAAQARQRSDVDAEIEHLGRAARWRMPGLSHDEAALDRLDAIARAADEVGDEERHIALAAYREIRRALLATRSFGVPHPDRFAHANERIAALMAAQEGAFGTDIAQGRDAETFHRELLEEVPGPDPWRANLAALAFVAWLLATGGFVLRGLDRDGRLRPRPALRWGGASLVFLVAWTVLLATVR